MSQLPGVLFSAFSTAAKDSGSNLIPKGINTNLCGHAQAVRRYDQCMSGKGIDDGEGASALLKGLPLYRMDTCAGKNKDKLHKVMLMRRDRYIAKQFINFDIAIRPYEILRTQAGLSVFVRIILLHLLAFCLKVEVLHFIQRWKAGF